MRSCFALKSKAYVPFSSHIPFDMPRSSMRITRW